MQTQTVLLIILSAIAALALVLFQYHYQISKIGKRPLLLSFLRFLTWFGAMLLLINPKFTKNDYSLEKTTLHVLVDNSSSMRQTNVSEVYQNLKERTDLAEKFDLVYHNFGNKLNTSDSLTLLGTNTNISKALKSLHTIYGAKNGAVVLLTDGNQTLGEDYEFYAKNQKFPIYPIVLGDTTRFEDLRIDQVNTNTYAFLKNKFPLEIFSSFQGKGTASSMLTVTSNGKSVYREKLNFSSSNSSKISSILLDADAVGTKNIKVSVQKLEGERNTKNNERSTAVEVIDEKTKIAILTGVMHPDIGALKKAIETNEQRVVIVQKSDEKRSTWDDIDLFILYQPTKSFKEIYEYINQKKINFFTVVGPKTDINFLNKTQESYSMQAFNYAEETFPDLNAGFSIFDISDFSLDNFPPLEGTMGDVSFKKSGETLMNRKVKGIRLNNPLLQFFEEENQREAVLFGENIWKWRMQNYRNEKNFKNFDEFVGKLVRYLATSKPKSRFSVDYSTVYEGTNNAKIKASYFDKAYEFDGDAKIEIQLMQIESGIESTYSMLLKNGYFEADLANLAPGSYSFTAAVLNENLSESGKFTILDFDVEQQFLSSNYKKLERLAQFTSAKSYFPNQIASLGDDLMAQDRFLPVQKSEENVVSLIDFRVLLALIAATLAIEWLIRKYNGLN